MVGTRQNYNVNYWLWGGGVCALMCPLGEDADGEEARQEWGRGLRIWHLPLSFSFSYRSKLKIALKMVYSLNNSTRNPSKRWL